jgi:hypothetical protein
MDKTETGNGIEEAVCWIAAVVAVPVYAFPVLRRYIELLGRFVILAWLIGPAIGLVCSYRLYRTGRYKSPARILLIVHVVMTAMVVYLGIIARTN